MSVSAEPRSRRALLGAGVGALVATVVSALGKASPVSAEDENIQIGHEYTTATSRTRIVNQTNSADVFVAEATGATIDRNGTAIVGIGGATGVAGSGNGIGVYANSPDGRALEATTDNGTAVYASATFNAYAIQTVLGRVRIGTSGVATIGAGKTSVKVLPFGQASVQVDANSFVLLTPMANIGSRGLWYSLDIPGNAITIRLSSSRSSATKVSWLLLYKPA